MTGSRLKRADVVGPLKGRTRCKAVIETPSTAVKTAHRNLTAHADQNAKKAYRSLLQYAFVHYIGRAQAKPAPTGLFPAPPYSPRKTISSDTSASPLPLAWQWKRRTAERTVR